MTQHKKRVPFSTLSLNIIKDVLHTPGTALENAVLQNHLNLFNQLNSVKALTILDNIIL